MERRLPNSAPRTEVFLKEAFSHGVHLKLQPLRWHPRLDNALQAVGIYHGDKEATFEDVGLMINPVVTGESARKLVILGIAVIWNESPRSIKEKYPFGTIPISKQPRARAPKFDQEDSDIIVAAKNGNSFQELQDLTGLPGDVLTSKRQRLKKYGVDVPYKNFSPRQYADLVRVCTDPEIPRKQFKKLEGKIALETAKHMAAKGIGVMSLTEAIRRCDYLIKTRALKPVKEMLSEADLLIVRQRILASGQDAGLEQIFYFVARRDLEAVKEELDRNSDFDKYKTKANSF